MPPLRTPHTRGFRVLVFVTACIVSGALTTAITSVGIAMAWRPSWKPSTDAFDIFIPWSWSVRERTWTGLLRLESSWMGSPFGLADMGSAQPPFHFVPDWASYARSPGPAAVGSECSVLAVSSGFPLPALCGGVLRRRGAGPMTEEVHGGFLLSSSRVLLGEAILVPLTPQPLGFALNALLYSILWALVRLTVSKVRARRGHGFQNCRKCGYPGIQGRNCPECGLPPEWSTG